MGPHYSSMMQLCFLMLGIFSAYVIATFINNLCRNLTFNYATKRFIKEIFTNTSSLYFMMHMPLGLSALFGIKFGNYMLRLTNVGEYLTNAIGVLVLLAGPALFSCLLAAYKNDNTLFVKRCYLFSGRKRGYSEVYVFLTLSKDSLFATSAILLNTEFALGLMLVLIVAEIVTATTTDVFVHKPILGLKLL